MEESKKGRSFDPGTPQVNPGYPRLQIAKALTTAEQHRDPATRERARLRVRKWTAVLNGILNGKLNVGSRTPLESVPAWATLEVVTGGFATGELLAGGPLLEHELALLTELSVTSNSDGRRVINGYFITDEGLARLRALLHSGCYDVVVPEEGALLVVAWLVENGYTDKARELLDELGPWFPKLRFYPIPLDRPRQFGSLVFLQDVGNTIASLKQIKPNRQILAQKEAIGVWAPIYDRIVSLFLETVKGPIPNLRTGPDGNWSRSQDGRFPVEGGWPCQHYPEDWIARAQEVLDEFDSQRRKHKLCGKPGHGKGSLAQLREYLRRCTASPKSLNSRDVGRIRMLLARYVARRGTPESSQCREIRRKQAMQAGGPTFREIARVVIGRLEVYPPDTGLDNIDAVTRPAADDEAERWDIEAGIPIPPSLQRKVQRCLRETAEVLIERGVITSSETLARVLPQMTSEIRAAGITDTTLRQLYAALYRAFRRRRSLLLLNLEKQIQIEELPWVTAIDRFRNNDLSTLELARQTLKEMALLTITSFPNVIIPNKLLQELRTLAKTADLDLPLVDEVAADIFMGTFSGKFLDAAKWAANLLENTLYATYYGIDFQQVRVISQNKSVKGSWFRKAVSDPFLELCESRAGVNYSGWNPAINGMIIEQQQILTTQNLAVIFVGLNLTDVLGHRFEDLARRCFIRICRRLQMKVDTWHANLIQIKNTAYAWRQMVFFLALLPNRNVTDFLRWAEDHLHEQPEEFRNRFSPALRGLVLATKGYSIDSDSARRSGAYRFLGWSKTRHWLITDVPKK
jgi:hypothetical protein